MYILNQTNTKLLKPNQMMHKFLLLFCISISSLSSYAQNIEGSWSGKINVGISLSLGVNITKENGKFTSTIDSPDQQVFDIPTDSTVIKGDSIFIYSEPMKVKIFGKISEGKIASTFDQMGSKTELILTPGKPVAKNFYQTPKGPFNYNIEEVVFENKWDKIKLAGTLTTPKNDDNYPIVILSSGSGAQDRDCSIFGHKSFWVIADYLTKKGIGVLRFDDRGTGKSEGNFSNTTVNGFANDVKSAVKFIKADKRFKKNKIGLIGHSEGSMHCAIAQYKNKNVDLYISLAGVGVTGKEVYLRQRRLIGESVNSTENEILKDSTLINNLIEINANYTGYEGGAPMREYAIKFLDENPDMLDSTNTKDAWLSLMLPFLNNDWAREFMSYDPSKYFGKSRIPVLIINGDKDIQVDCRQNVDGFLEILKAGKIRSYSTQEFGGLNHLFQKCTECTLAEYSELEETFNEEVTKAMAEYILEYIK